MAGYRGRRVSWAPGEQHRAERLNTRLRMISDPADFAALRAELNAARRSAWNTGRAVISTTAFGFLVVGLTRRQRSSVDQPEPAGSARPGALL